MKEINVTGLQCTQAVMAVLRELMPMEDNEEMHITYEEPNARRDIMALIKRRNYNLVKDEEKLLIISKL
jgi:TusA-related sulfurtransferase